MDVLSALVERNEKSEMIEKVNVGQHRYFVISFN